MRTFTIELRADFDNKEKYDMLLHAVREAAHRMLATATLLAEKRKPQIALQCGDMFEGTEAIELFDPNEELSEGAPAPGANDGGTASEGEESRGE